MRTADRGQSSVPTPTSADPWLTVSLSFDQTLHVPEASCVICVGCTHSLPWLLAATQPPERSSSLSVWVPVLLGGQVAPSGARLEWPVCHACRWFLIKKQQRGRCGTAEQPTAFPLVRKMSMEGRGTTSTGCLCLWLPSQGLGH